MGQPDPRRRIKPATIQSLLRKLEAIYTISRDNATVRGLAEGAYKELMGSVPWFTVQVTKRSEEVRSAARSMGLATEYKGQPISYEVISQRMETIAEARRLRVQYTIPTHWLKQA